jgi:hypothetical protein
MIKQHFTGPVGFSGLFFSKDLFAVLSLITFIFFLGSCKKDNDPAPPDPPQDPTLRVEFNNSTIPISLVDSGIIIFKKTGSATHILQRFEKHADSLRVDINSLSKGEWTANIYLYTGVANKNEKREYVISKIFNVSNNVTRVLLNAPTGALNDTWKPRVHYNFQKELDAYVPLNPEEPYFRLRVADRDKWKSYRVIRSAYNRIPGLGNELIASSEWKCEINCINNDRLFENSEFFIPFANNVKNKNWNNGEIEIIAIDQQNVERAYLFAYTK